MIPGDQNPIKAARLIPSKNRSIHRWLSKDPIGERGGINLYGFCGNNGVNRWDYLGNEYRKCEVQLYIDHVGPARTWLESWNNGLIADSQASPGAPGSYPGMERYARASALGCNFDGSNSTGKGIENFIPATYIPPNKSSEYADFSALGGTQLLGLVTAGNALGGIAPAWNAGMNSDSVPGVAPGVAAPILDRFNYDQRSQLRGYFKLWALNWKAALDQGHKLAKQGAKDGAKCCCAKITVSLRLSEATKSHFAVGTAVLSSDDWKYIGGKAELHYDNLSKGQHAHSFPNSPSDSVTFDLK